MKNFIIPILLLIAPTSNFGQVNPNEYNFGNNTYLEEKSSIDNPTAEKIKLQKIAKEVYITTDKKGKTSFTSQLSYNKNGQISHMIKKHWNGKSDNVIEYAYNKDNLLSNRRFYNTKKVANFENRQFTYNEKSLLKSFEINNKKGTKRKTTFEYNGSATAKREYFKKNQTSPFNSWTYTYHEDGSRKSTVLQKNGKIKHAWQYDCNPNGTLEKSKEASTVCINTTSNSDGGYTWTKKETDEKNKIIITESTFSKDSICQKYIQKYMDGSLKSAYTLNGLVSTHTNYKKGKKYITYINESDENGNNISHERIWHNNLKFNFKQTYKYDQNGLLVERNNYNSKGKLTSRTIVMRSFY
jgi:hypothetical protein